MNSLFAVALGGAFGSVLRYLMASAINLRLVDWRFPLGTFLVNVLGCLVIGLLSGMALKEGFFSTEARLFLFTGILGGFTTFSAFELETFNLLRSGEVLVAGGYVLASVAVGLLAVWAGFNLMARLAH